MKPSEENLSMSPAKIIPLSTHQSLQLKKYIKIGLYKELYKKGLLTDEQLNQLITLP